jgi:aspartate kinase
VIVMKFGGTSLADAGRIRRVAELVGERAHRRPLVVVSALAGVTNLLVEAAALAESGDESALASLLDRIEQRHEDVVAELELGETPAASLREAIGVEIAKLRDFTQGVLLVGECTPRTRDAILARGEMISHRIVAACVEGGVPVDPRTVMRTDARHGDATPDREALRVLASEQIRSRLDEGLVPVTGGYVGATAQDRLTTLGRGGGDLTATLLGVALEADEVQIWTDVDGMMTADPRVVPEARPLSEVSFQEASELAYFGARVLHPATIRPAVEDAVPVRIKNTLRPSAPGTSITARGAGASGPGVRAVAWKTGIAVVSVTSGRMLGAHGFLARVFDIFARHETPVDVVTTSEVSVSLTVDRLEHLSEIEAELAELGRLRVERDTALVCLVGCELLEHPELLGAVLGTLEGIPLRMFCLGSSAVNLTLVVSESHAEDAVRRLHARFLEEST